MRCPGIGIVELRERMAECGFERTIEETVAYIAEMVELGKAYLDENDMVHAPYCRVLHE